MLEIERLGITAGDFSLSELSLTVERGEYLVLLGPTGAGKTLLLEVLSGLLSPRVGNLRWDGQELTGLPPEHRPLAVVFQDHALFPHLSVAENIGYGPKVRRVPRAQRETRVTRLARMMGIEALLPRGVASLSGGEKQRVALARALAVEPALLLLDEPLSALDTTTRDRLREELRRVHLASGTTTVHVTHDREVALAVADRVAVLLDRRLHAPVPPHELFRRPRHRDVARFLGLPNVLDVDEARRHLPAAFFDPAHTGPGPGPGPGPNDATALWLRPEELKLAPPAAEAHPAASAASAASVPAPAPDRDSDAEPVPNLPTLQAEVSSVRLLGSQSEVRLRLLGTGAEDSHPDPQATASSTATATATATPSPLELVVRLSPREVTRLGLRPGQPTHVTVPPEAIHVMVDSS
jgi:ABC-type Fe3+/spermidine/putrescine transport system ATPase subunit